MNIENQISFLFDSKSKYISGKHSFDQCNICTIPVVCDEVSGIAKIEIRYIKKESFVINLIITEGIDRLCIGNGGHNRRNFNKLPKNYINYLKPLNITNNCKGNHWHHYEDNKDFIGTTDKITKNLPIARDFTKVVHNYIDDNLYEYCNDFNIAIKDFSLQDPYKILSLT